LSNAKAPFTFPIDEVEQFDARAANMRLQLLCRHNREYFLNESPTYDKYVKEVMPALKEKRKYTNPTRCRASKDRRQYGNQRLAGKKRH